MADRSSDEERTLTLEVSAFTDVELAPPGPPPPPPPPPPAVHKKGLFEKMKVRGCCGLRLTQRCVTLHLLLPHHY